MKRIFGKAFDVASALLFAFVALPILVLLYPFHHVRIGALLEDRIGHLGPNTEVFIRRLQLNGKPPRTSWLFLCWGGANRQLLEMYKRVLPIVESRWLRRASFAFLPILEKTPFYQPLPCTFDEHVEFSQCAPSLSFTQDEDDRGQAFLKSLGLERNDWFACIHVRDPMYMHARIGMSRTAIPKKDYRDVTLANYFPAIRWIVDQGGYVFRLGAIVSEPLPDLGPRVIDYATKMRSDFLDIYLLAHCRIFIGSDSGPSYVAACFNRPSAVANMSSFRQVGFGQNMMFLPKLLKRRSDGKILSFPEIRDMGLFDPTAEMFNNCYDQDYYDKTLQVDFLENSPEDILGLVKDRMALLEGLAPPPDGAPLQQAFRALYTGRNASSLSGPIGPSFALRYRHLIEAGTAQV